MSKRRDRFTDPTRVAAILRLAREGLPTFRSPDPTAAVTRRRAIALACFLLYWMAIIAARLIYLQIYQHEWLSRRVDAQARSRTLMPAWRGEIVGRHGWILAGSAPAASFFAVPDEIEYPEEAASLLAPVLQKDEPSLATRIRLARETGRDFMWVARKVEPEQDEQLRALKMRGIYSRSEKKRVYPGGPLAAHLLGYSDIDLVGIAGLELQYNSYLAGRPGLLIYQADAMRRGYERIEEPASDGLRLLTTVDEPLQMKVELLLDLALRESNSYAATAIVLDPRTGEILAMANAPGFDPNERPANQDDERLRRNRAVTDIYELGSFYDLFVLAAAKSEGLDSTSGILSECSGDASEAPARRSVRGKAGASSSSRAFMSPCSKEIPRLALRLGEKRLSDYLAGFGFGSKTGVDLPGEAEGISRNTFAWRRPAPEWIATGYGIGATPLQVVSALSVIANGGVWVQPYVVSRVVAADGQVAHQARPEQRRVLNQWHAEAVLNEMKRAFDREQTSKAADGADDIAALVSSVQKFDPAERRFSEKETSVSVAGFVPAVAAPGAPQFAIIVTLEDQGGAALSRKVALQTFRRIVKAARGGYALPPLEEEKIELSLLSAPTR